MKKKINIKMIVIFGVLLAVIVLGVVGVGAVRTFMSGASSGNEPKNVTAVSTDDGQGATVTWTSDKAAVSLVEYGTTAASLVLTAAETDSTVDHTLSLTSLRPATTYYYRIKVGEDVFDNGGIPYSFKTNGEVEPTPTEVVIAPTVATTNTACDPTIDYNKDGVVNSFDMAACKNNGGAGGSSPTSSVCSNPTDLNGDGKINSLDRIKCLQNQKL